MGPSCHLRHVSAHEIVCWQVTQRCNRTCPFCISASGPDHAIRRINRIEIVDRLVAIGTRKISISGGEPFLIRDLGQLVLHAMRLGIEVHITTNGDVLNQRIPHWLLEHRVPVNFSFYGQGACHDAIMGTGHYNRLLQTISELTRKGILVGANYMASDHSMRFAGAFLRDIHNVGVCRVLFIAYKPVGLAVDDDHAMTDFGTALDIVSELLATFDLDFNQGVRGHNYSEEMFLPVCDETGILTMVRAGTLQLHSLGSVFGDSVEMPGGGCLPIKDGMRVLWERRRVSPGVSVVKVLATK